jgi:hypothetical protein
MPEEGSHLCRLFGRIRKKQPKVDRMAQRIKHVAEGFLENESLTADLDDRAAQVLLDWGLTSSKRVAQGTVDLDDVEAEEAMYPRLRATRRLMRYVNRWVAQRQEMDTQASTTLLSRILDQAAIIYGERFRPPSEERRQVFLQRMAFTGAAGSAQQVVTSLREFIEDAVDRVTGEGEGKDDQEVE